MTNNRRPILFAVALLFAFSCLSQVCLAATLPGVSPEDAKQFIPVSQLKRGMRGYGLTVFQGTKIEKFDVEVLGVLKQTNTGKDLILVRVGGGPITKRDTGVIAGMSGSPIYFNGKLAGAISYASGFAKEPVGMATPIADMLEAWDTNLPKQPSGHSSTALAEPVSVGGKTVRKVEFAEPGDDNLGISDGVLHVQPLMTPMMVSGLSARGIGKLAQILRPYGIQPTAGPGGSAKKDVEATLEPGAALGVALASGDIDMTGVGTVTYRRGSRIVAFGHPMLGIGAIDAPMTTAYVEDLISSYRVSTKMASPIKTVGHIFQDRPWSVAGAVGNMPKTIPATIAVDDRASGRKRTFHVQVINHPQLASALLTMIVGEAIYDTHPMPGDATAEVEYEVVADQIGSIKRANTFFDSSEIEGSAISDVGMLLQLLSGNRFYPLDVTSVNVKVRILGKRNTATIDRIFVKEGEYEPGETVDVGVVMRPYKQDRVTKTFSVKIPATAPDGKLVLSVRGGGSPAMAQMMMANPGGEDGEIGAPAIMAGDSSSLANADNVKQLIQKYLEREKNNEVVVRLMMRSTAMNVGGEKLTGLPSAIADVMKSSRNSGLKMEREEVKQTFAQDVIVYGAAQLTIDVKRKDLTEQKSPPKITVPTPGGGEDIDSGTSSISVGYDNEEYFVKPGRGPMATDDEPKIDEATPEDDQEVTATKDDDDSLGKTADKTADKKSDKTADAAKPTEPKGKVKTVVRQPKTWSQRTQADWAKGTFSGVSASSENKLEMTPTLKKLVETPEQFVWCVAPAPDGIYAGTGDSGRIYHITDNGDMKVLFETGELEVHSLVADSQGNLYAGTSPHGKVFKITPDGKGEVIFTTAEKYVLALTLDPRGNLYAGVGDAGKVYRIPPGGEGSLFSQINEQQVLSLAWEPSGSLLVGTGINGVVYRVDASGQATPIFDAPEDAITSVVADSDGNVFAGTSPKGGVYKITKDGRSKAVYSKAARVLSMARDKSNNIYAVSDGTLVKITPDDTVIQLDSSRDKVQFLSLVFNQKTAALYAGTGNIGTIYISKCCDVIGEFESAVHDTKMISRWGRIRWAAETPEGTSVELQTRTGNVASPDDTWTGWSAPYTNGGGEQIVGDPARYIQYRVTLKTNSEACTPKVLSVTLAYLTPNQKPSVTLQAPAGGDFWSGKETIRWTGSDPDKDTLTYDVYYSKDCKDWKTLVGGMSSPTNGNGPTKKLTDEEIVAKVKAELEKSPDVPEDMKKQVAKDSLGSVPDDKSEPTESAASSGASSSKTTHAWDTKKVDDGVYRIKVVACDRTSNAIDPQSDDVISEPFVICNTPPKVLPRSKSVEVKGVGCATVAGSASSDLVGIAGVQFRVDGGTWTAAAADDGAFDSSYEAFAVVTDSLCVGSHKIEVEAVDSAGNAATAIIEVKVS